MGLQGWQRRRKHRHAMCLCPRDISAGHDTAEQGCVCSFTAESIQLNLYPVGLPGVHSTGGTCVNRS